MLQTLAIRNYRSLLDLRSELGALNIITGPNGSGKSNLYRALRLLAETAHGGVISALAREGGLHSVFWAGPEKISRAMRAGDVPVQGGPKLDRVRLKLGFCGETFSYAIALGLPKPSNSAFRFDPEIKHECIWAGPRYHPAAVLVERKNNLLRARPDERWVTITDRLDPYESIFTQVADLENLPEIYYLREQIRSWRFYDQFRTDADAPARQAQLATRTPVLHHDGRDLAAAIQTIIEIGDGRRLARAVADAFPGAEISVDYSPNNSTPMALRFHQPGLLRPLSAAELSDGTLRYLLWIAALLTPRPPQLMVLNEPENSLHPDLLPALGRLIRDAADDSQLWVITHDPDLVDTLEESAESHAIHLQKELGQTLIQGQSLLLSPPFTWPDQPNKK